MNIDCSAQSRLNAHKARQANYLPMQDKTVIVETTTIIMFATSISIPGAEYVGFSITLVASLITIEIVLLIDFNTEV